MRAPQSHISAIIYQLLTGWAVCPGYTFPSRGRYIRQVKEHWSILTPGWFKHTHGQRSQAPLQAVNPPAQGSYNSGSVCFSFIVVPSDLLRTSTQHPNQFLLMFLSFLKILKCRLEGRAWKEMTDCPAWLDVLCHMFWEHGGGGRCGKESVNVSEFHSPIIRAEWISCANNEIILAAGKETLNEGTAGCQRALLMSSRMFTTFKVELVT